MIRVGCGFDIHPLAAGRRLVLGGVDIPHHLGLAGHSDADALSHAMCDALLGAAGLGDIGALFPNTDSAFRGARSLALLAKVRAEIFSKSRAQVVNADATVALQRPLLSAHIPAMRANLAEAMGVSPGRVSVKATSGERLGFIGREQGAAVFAVALLEVAE